MNLDDEYSAKAAQQAAQRAQRPGAERRQQARQAQRRRITNQRLVPIADAGTLSDEVARLAEAWGATTRRRGHHAHDHE